MPLDGEQQERDPLLRRDPIEQGVEPERDLVVIELTIRRQRRIARLIGGWQERERNMATQSTTQLMHGHVDGDAGHPRLQCSFAPIPREAPDRLDERALNQILQVRRVADQPHDDPLDVEHVRPEERSGNQLPITFALNDAPPKPEPQTVTMPDVWDYNTFLIALRSWEGAVGTSAKLEVMRSRFLWSMAIKIGGTEKLATELGELPALRFDAHSFKLTRTGAQDTTSDERDMSIWVSDDNDRVPLKLVARTDYGDVQMEIVDYQPGSGKRVRP